MAALGPQRGGGEGTAGRVHLCVVDRKRSCRREDRGMGTGIRIGLERRARR